MTEHGHVDEPWWDRLDEPDFERFMALRENGLCGVEFCELPVDDTGRCSAHGLGATA